MENWSQYRCPWERRAFVSRESQSGCVGGENQHDCRGAYIISSGSILCFRHDLSSMVDDSPFEALIDRKEASNGDADSDGRYHDKR